MIVILVLLGPQWEQVRIVRTSPIPTRATSPPDPLIVLPAWNIVESVAAFWNLGNLLVVPHQGILDCIVNPLLLLRVRAAWMLLGKLLLLPSYNLHHLWPPSQGCWGQQNDDQMDWGRHPRPQGGGVSSETWSHLVSYLYSPPTCFQHPLCC